jgi:hypothetical protein
MFDQEVIDAVRRDENSRKVGPVYAFRDGGLYYRAESVNGQYMNLDQIHRYDAAFARAVRAFETIAFEDRDDNPAVYDVIAAHQILVEQDETIDPYGMLYRDEGCGG